MADPRPVRIARRAAPGRRSSDDDGDRRFWDSEAGGSGTFEGNEAGTGRGVRLFAVFGIALLAIYLVFLGLAATSPSPGVSGNWTVYALLTVLTLGLGAVGAAVTLLRAPSGVSFAPEFLIVSERLGRRRRWPLPPQLRLHVLQRYPRGLFGGEATELVELSDGKGQRSAYLVGRGFFDRLEPPS
ncbi:MAG: hypothetical protein L3K00_07305 [Thermoplasmata archaeon]|nr:hypothetical protein [Thermoplasmata archaeon]MCI4362052.1 hypothetical protein [Thermoplasmata archaeon]